MTDLLTVLPEFDVHPFAHILPALERSSISVTDLLSLPPADIAKRATIPSTEIARLSQAILVGLQNTIEIHNLEDHPTQAGSITILDDQLDAALHGGITQSSIVEFVGESAVGKTQFLLTLLLAVQLPSPLGLDRSALYISTESPLKTQRLLQIFEHHPKLAAIPLSDRPSLQRIHSIHVHDLEAQEHILRYQVPVAVKRHNIGLIVIDSIAANYRPEFGKTAGGPRKSAESFAKRSNQLTQIGALLRDIAADNNLAVVVANQVADRFSPTDTALHGFHNTQQTQRSYTPSQASASTQHHHQHDLTDQPEANANPSRIISTNDPLSLDHQQRFFTGWGDTRDASNLKTPSLGLTWANQLSARIALIKEPIYDDRPYHPGEDRDIVGWKRMFKIVMSTWCPPSQVEYEITSAGITSVTH